MSIGEEVRSRVLNENECDIYEISKFLSSLPASRRSGQAPFNMPNRSWRGTR